AVRCSAPEINGPVVQREFTFLLREACSPSLSATTGLAASNGAQAGTGVSRGRSTESNEPDNEETGGAHNSERAELGRQTRPSVVLSRSDEADRPSSGQRSLWQRKSAAPSRWTARNRRTRTRMYGGVGGGRGNPPADPIEHDVTHLLTGRRALA